MELGLGRELEVGIGDSGMGECDWGAFEGELCVTVVMVGVGCGLDKTGREGTKGLTHV